MTTAAATSPGTVSKLLWHFTGGPKWNERRQRQDRRPKAPDLAYDALVSILKNRELRLGNYAETVRILLPSRRSFDPDTRRLIEKKKVPLTVRSAPICCLADIPIAHLAYHSYRYGKFAIAFHRDAAADQGFNPVLYTLDDTRVIRSLYAGLNSLDSVDPDTISLLANGIELSADERPDRAAFDISSDAQLLQSEAEAIEDAVLAAKTSFRRLLAFVKTFSRDEFQTIYCEREWRSLKPFRFKYEDVAMIVLPKVIGKTHYFDRLLRSKLLRVSLPRSIPLVPWGDLIEH